MGVWSQQGLLAEPIARFGNTVSQQLPSQPARKAHVLEFFCVAIFSACVSGEMFLLFCRVVVVFDCQAIALAVFSHIVSPAVL